MLVTYHHLLRPTSGQRVHLDALLEMHRDVNAARNVRTRGLAAVAASRGVVAPGEPNVAGRGMRAPGTLLAA